MTALLLGLWVLALLLPFAPRRRQRRDVVLVIVVPVVFPDPVATPMGDEAWLRRQLEGLGRAER